LSLNAKYKLGYKKKTPTQFAVKWKIEQGEKVGKSQGQSRVSCDDGKKLNSNSPSACKFEFVPNPNDAWMRQHNCCTCIFAITAISRPPPWIFILFTLNRGHPF